MISFESALKIMKKYGYKSVSNSPFLYKNNNEVGISYSYIDDKYGITQRVVSFHNDIDLELFLKKYQWYKLNGKKYDVKLKLNNYEVSNPEVLYIRNNHVMTDNEMFNIETYDKTEAKNQKMSNVKRLLHVAEDLMNHYYQEKEIKAKYINNLYNKENELKRYYLELQRLVDKYNKNNTNISIDESTKEFKTNLELESKINSKLAEYKKKLPKKNDILLLINDVWVLNKSLEVNKGYLYALRYNDDIDEELRLVVTKIDFMKELLSKRRFNIVNLKKKFDSIDNQSTYESIYDDNFDEKYINFINKKYEQFDNINEYRLCEYLNNFKTNNEYDIEKNVLRCKDEVVEKKITYDTDINVVKKDLSKQFKENLNDNEKNALILFNSYYRELFNIILSIKNYNKLQLEELLIILNSKSNYSLLFEECYTKTKKVLELDINKNINKTIFKNIDFNNPKDFIKSIVKNIDVLININDKLKLKYNIILNFSTEDFDNLEDNKFIYTNANISTFMINKNKNYRVITAKVNKGVNVLFSPISLTKPILDKELQIIDIDNPEIILDTRDINIIKDKNTIIYSRFTANEVKEKEYTYIDRFDLNYKININKVLIEKRNINE